MSKNEDRISNESMEYFSRTKRIMDKWPKTESFKEELELIKPKVMDEIAGNERKFCMNVVASRVIEKILHLLSSKETIDLLLCLKNDIIKLSKDKCGSHIIEKILQNCWYIIEDEELKCHISNIEEIITIIYKSFNELFNDKYGIHILRIVVELLGKIDINKNIRDKFNGYEINEYFVPRNIEWCNDKLLKKYYNKFIELSQNIDIFNNTHICMFMCSLIFALYNVNKHLFDHFYDVLFLKIFNDSFQKQSFIGNVIITYTIQVFFTFSKDSKYQSNLCKILFDNNLNAIFNDKISINIIKTAIMTINHQQLSKILYNRILKHIPSSPNPMEINIISSIIVRADTLNIMDDKLSLKILKCLKNSTNIRYLLTFNNNCKDISKEQLLASNCNLLSCIFTHMKCKIIDSLIELNLNEILKLCIDPSGSRIIDAYFKSNNIDDIDKKKLLSKLSNENIINVGKNKYGSFCIENLWVYLDNKRKNELSHIFISTPYFKFNSHGKILCEKLKLSNYSINKKVHKSKNYT